MENSAESYQMLFCHASRWSPLSTSKSRWLRSSRANSCTTFIPVTVSWMFALMRASRTRVTRKASRTLSRKTTIAIASTGTTEKVQIARFASTQNKTAKKPAMRNTSMTSSTMPWLNISATCSTSLVARVTRRPTG